MHKNNQLDQHILQIVRQSEISEQSELQVLLEKEGYKVPQATLSRRLKRLHISKIAGFYKIIGDSSGMYPRVLRVQCSTTGMVVLHTPPGQAGSLAYFLDQQNSGIQLDFQKGNPILGTIAGDDTVLLILQSPDVQERVMRDLYTYFPYLTVD